MSNAQQTRHFDIIDRSRYVLVAEYLGAERLPGDRTARWFFDKQEQRWFTASGWNRPNRKRPLTQKQAEQVAGMILGG